MSLTSATPRRPLVVIGAGITGTSVAHHLAERGVIGVEVLDAGPLEQLRGSTGHAPGLVGVYDRDPDLHRLAAASWAQYAALDTAGARTSHAVGSIELARTPAGAAALEDKVADAQRLGVEVELVELDAAAAALPGLALSGALRAARFAEGGVAVAPEVVRQLRRRAQDAGASFRAHAPVQRLVVERGAVTAIETGDEVVPVAGVVLATGLWGAVLARTAGLHAPIVPVVHPYAVTSPEPGATPEDPPRLPCVRDPEQLIYLRHHAGGFGVGSYRHEPVAADAAGLGSATLPLEAGALRDALQTDLLGARARDRFAAAFAGVFSVTPDGLPLLGAVEGIDGLWLAEAIWVTHAAGAGDLLAAAITGDAPPVPLAALDPARWRDADPQTAHTAAVESYRTIYPPVGSPAVEPLAGA